MARATDWDLSSNSVLEVPGGETDSLYVPTHQLTKPQELEYYVRHIRVTFLQMFNGDARYFPLIDFRTIQHLQTRCPQLCDNDLDFIKEGMSSWTLFPLITDNSSRLQLQDSLLKISCAIPSLYTFLEDTKWLEPGLCAMRGLLPAGCRESTRLAFSRIYSSRGQTEGQVKIENSQGQFCFVSGDEKVAFDSSYCQLWLFAWRHFPDLTSFTPRKDKGRAKPPVKAKSQSRWHELAALASELGYESQEISRIKSQDPDPAMAEGLLSQVSCEGTHDASLELHQQSVQSICAVVKAYRAGLARQAPTNAPADRGPIGLEHRCGRPHETPLRKSGPWFYLPNVFKSQTSPASYFSFNRDIFRAFFSDPWKDSSWVACPRPENQFLVPSTSNQSSGALSHPSAGANAAAPTTQCSENLNDTMQYEQENLPPDDTMQYEQENLPPDDTMQYEQETQLFEDTDMPPTLNDPIQAPNSMPPSDVHVNNVQVQQDQPSLLATWKSLTTGDILIVHMEDCVYQVLPLENPEGRMDQAQRLKQLCSVYMNDCFATCFSSNRFKTFNIERTDPKRYWHRAEDGTILKDGIVYLFRQNSGLFGKAQAMFQPSSAEDRVAKISKEFNDKAVLPVTALSLQGQVPNMCVASPPPSA